MTLEVSDANNQSWVKPCEIDAGAPILVRMVWTVLDEYSMDAKGNKIIFMSPPEFPYDMKYGNWTPQPLFLDSGIQDPVDFFCSRLFAGSVNLFQDNEDYVFITVEDREWKIPAGLMNIVAIND